MTLRIGATRVDFVGVSTNAGWSAGAPETTSTGFKITFRNGPDEVEFEARLESNGQVRTTVKVGSSDGSPEAEDE